MKTVTTVAAQRPRNWLLFLLIAGFLFANPPLPTLAKSLKINVGEFTLKNGMKVVVIPDHRAPVVTHMVWYKVGSADEKTGKSGLAHFLEHLMFKGTKKVPEDFSKIIARNGGQDNAFTFYDYTAYHQRISKDRLEMVMQMEADRMQNLVLSEKDVKTELEVVKEERRTRTDNKPSAQLSEQMQASLYLAHHYGVPVIGWMSDIKGLTRQDALDFYHQYYTPSNAILVVAGDVTTQKVKKLAQKIYGGLENTASPGPRLRTKEPKPIAARRVMLQDPRVASPFVMRAYLTPSARTAKMPESQALEILAEVLGASTTGRLYRQLVIKEKIAVAAESWYSGNGMDYGTFNFYASPGANVSLQDLEKRADVVVADVIKNGITQDELDRARKKLQAQTAYLLDSQNSLANVFGRTLATGGTVKDVLEWDDRLNAVTLDDIKAVAKKYLRLERSVTGFLESSKPTMATPKRAPKVEATQ